jgi:hypothetical protein
LSGGAAESRALSIKVNAGGHHFYIAFFQIFGGAMIAGGGAGVAGGNTIYISFVTHGLFFNKEILTKIKTREQFLEASLINLFFCWLKAGNLSI